MLARYRTARMMLAVVLLGLICVGITAATTAHAGNQLFEASWTVKAAGNEITTGNGASAVYSAWGVPLGVQCDPNQPRCPFNSTPTDGIGNFNRVGGSVAYCYPWLNWQGYEATARPAKGGTAMTVNGQTIPPIYRNPGFFSSAGQPRATSCNPQTTDGYGGKGLVQKGHPITGTWGAMTTGTPGKGGFTIAAAPLNHKAGIRATGVIGSWGAASSFNSYHYTYATLRNDAGAFGPGNGPGSFTLTYTMGDATLRVKQGAAKFGGTMRMLGALTTKACYFQVGGCWLGENDYRYDAIGASAYTTPMGYVYAGYVATHRGYYYHTTLKQTTTFAVEGVRFPWTTGSVTVRANNSFGSNRTVHYAQGFDNRNTTGMGTIQLVTPVLTRWVKTGGGWMYGGIGILRIKFIASATDSDSDGISDELDNCSASVNPAQDDTDADDCGNICDTDYDQNGVTGWSDYGVFTQCWATTAELCQHVEPIGGGALVGFPDLGALASQFGQAPGPSGTTGGTTACP